MMGLYLLDLFQLLKRDNKNIVIFQDDKDSSIVIMDKLGCNKKAGKMINGEIEQWNHKETDENILKELESFQLTVSCHFKDTTYYKQMGFCVYSRYTLL